MIVIESERLFLREYKDSDLGDLMKIISDEETMKHFPKPYDERGARRWIEWSVEHCKKHGFGFWAVILKESGELIGNCGLTLQTIDGECLPEIGYHINKNFWKRGYASEAARAVRDWAFGNTEYSTLYSYMTVGNIGSRKVAQANGMSFVKEFSDEDYERLCVYAITRDEWKKVGC